MGDLLDLVRRLGLDQPETWVPPTTPMPVTRPPDFRATNQFDPASGSPVVAPDVALPEQAAPLTGWWRRAADEAINAIVGVTKGVTGVGEQGPAGPTWTNAGAFASAVPLGAGELLFGAIGKKLPRFAKALQAYRAPTEAGTLAAPFYSRLDEAAAALPGKFGAGQLAKGQVSAEELAIRGVPEFLAAQGGRPIPKAALTEHLAAHPVPGIAVKTLGDAPVDLIAARQAVEQRAATMRAAAFDDPTDWVGVSQLDRSNAHWWALEAAGGDARALRKLQEIAVDPDHLDTLLAFGRLRNESTGLARQLEQFPAPQFASYQLPGGTNYRETLITLPARGGVSADEVRAMGTGPITADQIRAQTARGSVAAPEFRSSHFSEPNILAHTRSNEREIPGLGKGTFLEEVQSDWHQKGKTKGYQTGDPEAVKRDLTRRHEALRAQLDDLGEGNTAEHQAVRDQIGALTDEWNAFHDQGQYGVPDAPFKETWPDLALKHHLAEAAANPDTQWIGFTSGETQAARYNLRQHIDELHYQPNERRLLAFTKNGDKAMDEIVDPDKIADYIGKEAGQKLLAQGFDHEYRTSHVLRGAELELGGEGMHEFYDKLLPKRLEKIVKPYGGTVERLQPQRSVQAIKADMDALVANTGDFGPAFTQAFDALEAEKQRALVDPKLTGSWILRLTPELKERILRYGLPLLTGVAAIEAGEALDGSPFGETGVPPA